MGMNQLPPIGSVRTVQGVGAMPAARSAELQPQTPVHSFRQLLLESLEHVNSMQKNAEHAVQQLALGEDVDTAEVLTSIQKADLTFRLMLQIRNKLLQAYQELNQIRI
jgi:flagellar hook-basal body complex protein FliE